MALLKGHQSNVQNLLRLNLWYLLRTPLLISGVFIFYKRILLYGTNVDNSAAFLYQEKIFGKIE